MTSTRNTSRPKFAFPALLIDKNIGSKMLPALLIKAGFTVMRSTGVLPHETPDTEIIRYCTDHGYVLLSADKKIETTFVNRAAVREAKARVILLEDNQSTPACWFSAIWTARRELLAALENPGPLFVTLGKARSNLSAARNADGKPFKPRTPKLPATKRLRVTRKGVDDAQAHLFPHLA